MKNSNAIALRMFQIITVVAFIISGLVVENLIKVNAETKFNESNLKEEMPNLQGKAATEYLQKTGKYNSLLEAMNYENKVQDNILPANSIYLRTKKIIDSDGATQDQFGKSVAISGNTAIIGSWRDDIGINLDQGSVSIYVYDGDTWNLQQPKLIASDGAAEDQFGASVDIDGDTVIIGADMADPGGHTNQGAAYIFVRSGTVWSQQTKLTNDNDGANPEADRFGYSVALEGNRAIIGAPFDNIDPVAGGILHGSAKVYERNGTSWIALGNKILGLEGSSVFGFSVGISGNRVIIGAPVHNV
jgi:hypothetical protein